MIEIANLSRSFGERTILERLSWTFETRSCTHIQAPNGTGKTTLIRCLLGLDRYEGTVMFDGQERTQVRATIGALFEDPPVYPHLSGQQNLTLLSGRRRDENHPSLLPGRRLLRRKLEGYSSGERKRLALTACLARNPKYVFLDEVDTGVDAEALQGIGDQIRELAKSATVVLVGHNHVFYESLADRAVSLRDGKLIEA